MWHWSSLDSHPGRLLQCLWEAYGSWGLLTEMKYGPSDVKFKQTNTASQLWKTTHCLNCDLDLVREVEYVIKACVGSWTKVSQRLNSTTSVCFVSSSPINTLGYSVNIFDDLKQPGHVPSCLMLPIIDESASMMMPGHQILEPPFSGIGVNAFYVFTVVHLISFMQLQINVCKYYKKM